MQWFALVALTLATACGHREHVPEPPQPQIASGARGDATAHEASSPNAATCTTAPHELAPGVIAERHAVTATPLIGEPCLDLVRIDLAQHRARLLVAARDGGARTAPEWRDAFHLAAVINAGMFQSDGTSVGLMIDDGTALATDKPKMGGYLAFGPRHDGDPAALVTGPTCAGFDLHALRDRYRYITQSYRLLGCDGAKLAWADPKHYSAVAIGVDRSGRLVLIHARAAWTMAELSVALGELDLAGALFLEGGPEASLIAGPLALLGSYETGFNENDTNAEFWKLPLVIGVD